MITPEFTVIPAPPGYFLLTYDRLPDVGEVLDREPIIAFRIPHDDGAPVPVTLFGHPCHNRDWTYIIGPDDAVDTPDIVRWPTFRSWLEEMRARYSEARPWREVYSDGALK